MAGKRDKDLAGIAVIREIGKKWCDDSQLSALVGIRQDQEGGIASLWARSPDEKEIRHLQSLVGELPLRPPEVSGAFSTGPASWTKGDPPKSGIKGSIYSGYPIRGYVCSTGLWNLGGLFTGLFLDRDSGDRWGIAAAHCLWGTDVAGWPLAGYRWNLGPVRILSPWSPPGEGDVLLADAALIAIAESGLKGQTRSWKKTKFDFRMCNKKGCKYINAKPKSYCIKVPYGGRCVTLKDHLVIQKKAFATDGDSGALVEKRDESELGMVVAVSLGDTHVAVTPWIMVLASLGLHNATLERLT